ncbi:TPA: restriction endonuclease subunit S [Escherichia coli]|uniref:restriction endonuclease subunit S n=2 Tax=Escherichia coli TaxID=562 RepID=UPI0004D65A70|nr:restriction endonuclease subunit S [Escherichia coli]EFH3315413.1 restriction endonuclease subunit S [Escherichia coli]EHH8687276.1 restriction endonuclease subunit S [Escherichia coli]EHI1116774.1 restriction endonuclease subunit S [Escherichia coli]EJZ2706462.1 restriction endonuclease subunit S [Escherichia coli]KDY64200.1 type I restriction modification DNA specificity domain protein [Escherichia coli 2-460-02_S4_C2]
MSELSYLEKLLDGVEVEWKTLGEVAKYVRGLIYSKSSESADGQGYKVLRANNITLSNNCLNLNDVKVVRFDTKVKSSQKLYKNDILISAASGSREHVGKVAYIESDIDYYFGGFMGVVRCDEKLNPRYLFHVLTSDIFQKYLDEMLNSSTINNLNSAVMGRFKIPLPCPDTPEKSLAIQSEIVRTLDKFTALTAELTAELNMRKKQYNYYRDQLLSFKEGEVEWKTLGEIGEFIRGKRFTKADYVEDGGISVIHYGEIYTRYGVYTTHSLSQVRADMAASLRYAKHGDVVITDVGETVEDVGKAVAWLGDDDIAIHDHCYAFRHSLNPKFISYYMQTDSFISEKAKYVARTKVNTLLINGFSKIMIPVPYPKDHEKSLKEQARIVAILDKFDTLTNSITEGLPREIELRQKQYEYYRDLLFSFPKPETVSN